MILNQCSGSHASQLTTQPWYLYKDSKALLKSLERRYRLDASSGTASASRALPEQLVVSLFASGHTSWSLLTEVTLPNSSSVGQRDNHASSNHISNKQVPSREQLVVSLVATHPDQVFANLFLSTGWQMRRCVYLPSASHQPNNGNFSLNRLCAPPKRSANACHKWKSKYIGNLVFYLFDTPGWVEWGMGMSRKGATHCSPLEALSTVAAKISREGTTD